MLGLKARALHALAARDLAAVLLAAPAAGAVTLALRRWLLARLGG